MFNRVAINGLVRSSMNAQVGLPVAGQVLLAHYYPAGDRFLEDSGEDFAITVRDFARLSNVD
jgi:hypothetical protein